MTWQHFVVMKNVLLSQEARRCSRFNRADDQLSRAASAIFLASKEADDGYSDLRAFGAPSECGALIMNAAIKRGRARLAATGLTMNETERLFELRCDLKPRFFPWLAFDLDQPLRRTW